MRRRTLKRCPSLFFGLFGIAQGASFESDPVHSTLGNLPPNAFEQKSAITQPIDLFDKT